MPDQAKNMLIGIFVVAACAIVLFVLMFLHPSVGDEKSLLRVRFANIDKISIGTRVTFAGKPVGEVIAITELPDMETERKAVNGFVYVYELTLRVDSGVKVFDTDMIASRTSGLLGEKSVAIIPGPAKPGEEIHLVNNEVIYATETASVEESLQELKVIGDKVAVALDGFIETFDTLKEKKFWDNLSITASNVSDITSALNNPKMLSETIANVHTVTANAVKSWEKVDASLDNLSSITGRVNKGEGTLGQFLNREDIYLRTAALLSKADTTMNDINHYGVLFHLDKGWQRLRARRMNLLQQLQSPQEFRNYFNDELDQVQTSLERVAAIMEQLQGQSPCECYDLINSGEFSKVYAELLRKLSALEEEVRMYNQQVMDSAVQQTEFRPPFECCQ